MCELLPESWRVEPSSCRSQRPRRGLVLHDFTLWTECHPTLVAMLAVRHPEKTPHFMAYLCTITRASRNFEGTAWATYDKAYRRQAANHKSLDWATIDPAPCAMRLSPGGRSLSPAADIALPTLTRHRSVCLLQRSAGGGGGGESTKPRL